MTQLAITSLNIYLTPDIEVLCPPILQFSCVKLEKQQGYCLYAHGILELRLQIEPIPKNIFLEMSLFAI